MLSDLLIAGDTIVNKCIWFSFTSCGLVGKTRNEHVSKQMITNWNKYHEGMNRMLCFGDRARR